MQYSEYKNNRFIEQPLGHLFIKTSALVVNLTSLVMAFWYGEFGMEWHKIVSHGLFGTLPVHAMTISMILCATKYSREMSIIHDYLCGAVCFTTSGVTFFLTESDGPTALFMGITSFLLAFDLVIHCVTES